MELIGKVIVLLLLFQWQIGQRAFSTSSGGSSHTFSALTNHDHGGTCNGTSCTYSGFTAIAAGSPAVLFTYSAGATISSVSGCGTWVTGTNSSFSLTNSSGALNAAYNVGMTSSCTSVTVTLSSSQSNWDIVIDSATASPSSGVVLDALGTNVNTTCQNCAASSFSGLAGTSDLMIQAIGSSATYAGSTVSSPYAWDAAQDAIGALNISSGTAPTINFGSTGYFASLGYAFK